MTPSGQSSSKKASISQYHPFLRGYLNDAGILWALLFTTVVLLAVNQGGCLNNCTRRGTYFGQTQNAIAQTNIAGGEETSATSQFLGRDTATKRHNAVIGEEIENDEQADNATNNCCSTSKILISTFLIISIPVALISTYDCCDWDHEGWCTCNKPCCWYLPNESNGKNCCENNCYPCCESCWSCCNGGFAAGTLIILIIRMWPIK